MSRWRIAEKELNGQRVYAVYRVRNDEFPDADGNREYVSAFIQNHAWCVRRADELNAWRDGLIQIIAELQKE